MDLVQGVPFKREFFLSDVSDHIAGKTGANPVVYLSKNGAAFVVAAGLVSESGRGWYFIDLTALDTNTLGPLAYSVTGTGADPSDFSDYIKSPTAALNRLFTDQTNSYLTVAEGDAYFATRLNSEAWTNANEDQKIAAVLQSTREIDVLNFAGDKADEDQTLEFPRGDQETIPDSIKIACAEIAIAHLDGIDLEIEMRNLNRVASGYAQTRVNYTRDFIQEAIAHGIVSSLAWFHLKPFLRDARTIILSRKD